MEPKRTGSLYRSPSFHLRRALWRCVLAVGILVIIAFLVFSGLCCLAMTNYAGWGTEPPIRGFRAVRIVILGGLLFSLQPALDHWYISAPVLALTLYSWFELHRLGRERLSKAATQPLDSEDYA